MKKHAFTPADDTLVFETIEATVRVRTTEGDPVPDVDGEQKTSDWSTIGTTDRAGAVTFEVFAGKGRAYRATVGDVTVQRSKKFTKAKSVLVLKFTPDVLEDEDVAPEAEEDPEE